MDASIQYPLFLILAPLAALLSIGVILYARLAYPSPETTALTWMIVVIAGWLVFNTLELLAPTETGTLFWSKVTYLFIAFSSVAWMGFALRYTGHDKWMGIRRFPLLCIIPTLTGLFVWTNDLHQLLWQGYHYTSAGNMLAINVDYGPWFWVHVCYAYLLIFLGAILILQKYFRSFTLYRRQSTWLVIGALIPIAANVIHIFHLVPGLRKDYTSISFALASIAFAVGIFRYRLFDLHPTTRAAMIDKMDYAMLALDERGTVVDINPAAATLIGKAPNQIIGQTAEEVFSPWQNMIDLYRGPMDLQAEIELNIQGKRRWYDLRLSPMSSQQGQPTGRLIVLRDISARVQAVAQLRRYTDELIASNEELDAFAHTVAHDLKAPLSTLISSGQLLKNSYQIFPPEDVNNFLGIIIRNGEKISSIVDSLLLLSSVRKFEDISIVPVETEEVVFDVLDRLSVLREESQAEIIRPDRWPAAVGHAPWVEEVWANYISNAIKYGGQPPRVELGADKLGHADTPTGGGPPMVRFWVRDNGPGIPPAGQVRLFQPFTRLVSTPTGGHGLGLSIVQRIVDKLGGEVGVESQVGAGSLFWFTLPAASSQITTDKL